MVCGNFILPEPASYVFFFALFNLRNLLYLIRTLRSFEMLETISFDDAKKLYSSDNVPIVCPRCGLKMKMTDKKMLKFISNKCTCSRCLKTIKTGRYIFDWEKVDFVFNE